MNTLHSVWNKSLIRQKEERVRCKKLLWLPYYGAVSVMYCRIVGIPLYRFVKHLLRFLFLLRRPYLVLSQLGAAVRSNCSYRMNWTPVVSRWSVLGEETPISVAWTP